MFTTPFALPFLLPLATYLLGDTTNLLSSSNTITTRLLQTTLVSTNLSVLDFGPHYFEYLQLTARNNFHSVYLIFNPGYYVI